MKAKIDRTTHQELLPMLMNKKVFSNYKGIPNKESVLQAAREKLGTDKLTTEQEREALAAAGNYKAGAYVFRDYGTYAIGFSSKLYLDETLAQHMEEEIRETVTSEEQIAQALGKIKLFTLAHKLSMILLSEAYVQRKHTGLCIEKQKLIEYLGGTSNDKSLYSSVSDAMFSLCHLTYVRFQYRNNTNLPKSKGLGMFIYNVLEDARSYTVDINPMFLGCVLDLFGDVHPENERKDLFSRGYLEYPIGLLPSMRKYSSAAYLLANFLISDSGNAKLASEGLKTVSYTLERYMNEAGITEQRPDRAQKLLIAALEEITFVTSVEPSLEVLKTKPTKWFRGRQIRISIPIELEGGTV
jgi:hypothetical protein